MTAHLSRFRLSLPISQRNQNHSPGPVGQSRSGGQSRPSQFNSLFFTPGGAKDPFRPGEPPERPEPDEHFSPTTSVSFCHRLPITTQPKAG